MGLFSKLSSVFGASKQEKQLGGLAQASYNSPDVQRFLPTYLRNKYTDPYLKAGIGNIGALIANPGGLSPNIAESVAPQLSSESESIAQNFRNLQQEQAGSAARTNAPVSLQDAISSALGIGQERAQREARRGAYTQSEQLRRSDLENYYKLLDIIHQYVSTGRGQSLQGFSNAAQTAEARQSSMMGMIGQIIAAAGVGGIAGAAA